jgi:F-type H+-transporting ATPase subunit epsilon
MMWYRQGSEKHNLAVSVGFAEVLPDRVTVIAQVAERAEDLDQARAEAGMARAEEMMHAMPIEIDFERARLSLLRTLQQLQAETRRGGGTI